MGWRYTWLVCGGVSLLLWFARFFIYPIPESPKYLISQGRDAEAIQVIQFIANQNKVTSHLTLEQLQAAGAGQQHVLSTSGEHLDEEKTQSKQNFNVKVLHSSDDPETNNATSTRWNPKSYNLDQLKRSLREVDSSHFKALFATRKMALNTTLVMACWSLIGLAYPLFNGLIALYIKQSGGSSAGPDSQSEQYKQLVIIAVCGIPGSLIATALVELPFAGRKGSMALFTCLTGCFLFGFTTARTPSAVLGWNCGVSLAQNAMYGVSRESFLRALKVPLKISL